MNILYTQIQSTRTVRLLFQDLRGGQNPRVSVSLQQTCIFFAGVACLHSKGETGSSVVTRLAAAFEQDLQAQDPGEMTLLLCQWPS